MEHPPTPGNKIKVTFLTTSFPRFQGDNAGNFVYKFARGLSQNGCEVRAIAPHDSQVETDWAGFTVDHFRYFPERWQSLAYGAGIVSRIKQNLARLFQVPFFLTSFLISTLKAQPHSDILHSFWLPSAMVATATKFLTGIPVLVGILGSDILLMKTYGIRTLFKLILSYADAIVCESESFREEIKKLGIPENKISVISYGIDLELFKPRDKVSVRKRLGLPENKTVILTVGGLSPRKGHRYLLEAMSDLTGKTERPATLVILGEGEARDELLSLTETLGLREHVNFIGFQKFSEVPYWLGAADIFVLPSLLEGTPNVILEAMACGLPVISTNVGAIPDMIRDRYDGVLVPPKSSTDLARAIISLVEDNSLHEQLGRNALETIRTRYGSWGKQSSQLKSLYEKILTRRE